MLATYYSPFALFLSLSLPVTSDMNVEIYLYLKNEEFVGDFISVPSLLCLLIWRCHRCSEPRYHRAVEPIISSDDSSSSCLRWTSTSSSSCTGGLRSALASSTLRCWSFPWPSWASPDSCCGSCKELNQKVILSNLCFLPAVLAERQKKGVKKVIQH